MVLATWRQRVLSQAPLTVSSPSSWKLNSKFSCSVGGRTTKANALTHSAKEARRATILKPSFALGGQCRGLGRRGVDLSYSSRVNLLAPSPSVSCRSKTRRICDSGISAMCLSGGGGLVCPTGLLNVLITLWRLRAICKDTKSKRRQLQIPLIDPG